MAGKIRNQDVVSPPEKPFTQFFKLPGAIGVAVDEHDRLIGPVPMGHEFDLGVRNDLRLLPLPEFRNSPLGFLVRARRVGLGNEGADRQGAEEQEYKAQDCSSKQQDRSHRSSTCPVRRRLRHSPSACSFIFARRISALHPSHGRSGAPWTVNVPEHGKPAALEEDRKASVS